MRQPLFVLTLALAALACRAADDTTGPASSSQAPGVAAAQPAASAAPGPQGPGGAPAPASSPADGIVPVPGWAPRRPRVPAAPLATAVAATDAAPKTDYHAKVSAEAQWRLAGYNNDEVVYTIFVTSHDPSILRCTLDLSGFFDENGQKVPVTDRQSMTIFPDQVLQIGNWQGMDQKSGATYSVQCHPI